MTTRKYKYLGGAYGTGPVEVEIKVNGATVFAGNLPQISDEPDPHSLTVGSPPPTNVIAEWEVDSGSSETVSFNLVNLSTTGRVFLAQTVANYTMKENSNDNFLAGQTRWVPGGPDYFGGYAEWISGTAYDPILTPLFDGAAIERPPGEQGQYYYLINPGQEFTCNIQCAPSIT